MPDCPIDGDWGVWSDWSDCQSDCGVATRHRTRACIDPPPAHGGRGCEGDAEEYHDCKLDRCPSEYRAIFVLHLERKLGTEALLQFSTTSSLG
jgi:hypothetical protein